MEEKQDEVTNNEIETTEENKLLTEEHDGELIANLTEKIDSLNDKLLRSFADSENLRNRMNKMIEEAREYSIVNFAKDIVTVLDHLNMALAHVPEVLSTDAKVIVDGVLMTKKELESVFKKHGLEQIEPKPGDNFDYNNHYAISQIASDEHKEGTIVNIMQIGYKIKDRLIRPCSVIVSKKG